MKLSESTLLFLGIIGISIAAVYFIPKPSIDVMFIALAWCSLAIFIISLGAWLSIALYGGNPHNFILVVMFYSFFAMAIGFTIPSLAKSDERKRECAAIGGEWSYIGENEGYGCQKEYTSCGPDENKPGFTICETKFKRVYPEGGV